MARSLSKDRILSLVICATVIVCANVLNTQGMLLYPPRYQPELDQLSLEKYITDDYLFNMHINCLLYDGPCDPVGRWMKPRMASYFLSSCILCTPNQEKETSKFMTWLYQNHPQLFRIGIGKYLDANGITLPQKSKFREQVQKMNVPKVMISSIESGTQPEKTEEPGSNPDSQETTSIDGEKSETSSKDPNPSIKPENNEDNSSVSERVLNPSARRNKFSSAISFSRRADGSSLGPPGIGNGDKNSPVIEDDEADMDFKFYHE